MSGGSEREGRRRLGSAGSRIGAAILVAAVLAAGALVRLRERPAVHAAPATPVEDPSLGSPLRSVGPQPSGRGVEPQRSAVATTRNERSPTPVEAALPDDAVVLARLHELAASDPEQSLRLARAALQRAPNGPDAPELDWNAVKALYNMGRTDAAIDEAKRMVGNYPESDFSMDVRRHLLFPQPNR